MKIDNKLILQYSKNLTVLYVEDDDSLRTTTGEIFKNYFLKVDFAVDGKDGIEKYNNYFKSNGTRYDLIISDINMPNINGVEMTSLILNDYYDQAVVFITAHNEVEYLQRSIDLGVDGFIAKPIKLEQLKKILYKVSQLVHDRKTVNTHYEIIENLNVSLQAKNEELEKSLRLLNTMVAQKSKPIKVIENTQQKTEVPEQNKSSIIGQMDLFVSDDLQEIEDLHQEIDSNVVLVINSKEQNVDNHIRAISSGFSSYASTLSYYSFFHELSVTMKEFSMILKDRELPDDKVIVYDIFVLLESFMFVLGKWSDKLKNGDSDKLNDLDASLISDMQTIITMWTMSEDEGEIEFF